MPVKWNTNRKENEEKQEEFLNKVYGVGWRERAEQQQKQEETPEKDKAPVFRRRA